MRPTAGALLCTYSPVSTRENHDRCFRTENARVTYISEERWGARIIATSSITVPGQRRELVDIIGFDVSGVAELAL